MIDSSGVATARYSGREPPYGTWNLISYTKGVLFMKTILCKVIYDSIDQIVGRHTEWSHSTETHRSNYDWQVEFSIVNDQAVKVWTTYKSI